MSTSNRKEKQTQLQTDFLTAFESQARESVRRLVQALFEEELKSLAGQSHRRGRGAEGVYRAGSDPGSIRAAGQRLRVRKPRLKQANREIPLQSYQALKNKDLLQPRIMAHMIAGVSTRDYDELLEEISDGLGLSKSSVSRAFVQGSKQALEELKTRDLSKQTWCAIQIDAIYFAGRSIIVALGIDGIGEKVVLGLVEGNTESSTVCSDLLQSLVARGVRADLPFLFVIDGGKGLRKAIRDVFGANFPVQRCVIHKARNIEAYIPERAYLEFRMRWKKMRSMERYADASQELNNLKQWLFRINADAAASLEEAGEELLTVHRIGADRILRRALTSTNLIETLFSRVRATTQRIKNWRCSGDQIQRWVAVALLHTEKNSNRIHGYFECNSFVAKLHKNCLQEELTAA